ncbi:hypothetical protein Tco_1374235 [Tanacetum coccineum]
MDDEPMWAVDCVVALTPGSVITIPKTTNEFAIKELLFRMLGLLEVITFVSLKILSRTMEVRSLIMLGLGH